MRILDKDNDQAVGNILIMLTPSEAKELGDTIKQLTSEVGDHLHLSDDNYQREITFAIYTPDNTHTFSQRIIKLIEKES